MQGSANEKGGKVTFQGDDIIFTFLEKQLSRFSSSDVVMLGEMTLGAGNSFLVFVLKNGKQHCIPFHHISNIIELIVHLSKRLNTQIAFTLGNSEADSKVIYPPDMAGKRIFYIISDSPPGKVRVTENGAGLRLVLREEIKNYKPPVK